MLTLLFFWSSSSFSCLNITFEKHFSQFPLIALFPRKLFSKIFMFFLLASNQNHIQYKYHNHCRKKDSDDVVVVLNTNNLHSIIITTRVQKMPCEHAKCFRQQKNAFFFFLFLDFLDFSIEIIFKNWFVGITFRSSVVHT